MRVLIATYVVVEGVIITATGGSSVASTIATNGGTGNNQFLGQTLIVVVVVGGGGGPFGPQNFNCFLECLNLLLGKNKLASYTIKLGFRLLWFIQYKGAQSITFLFIFCQLFGAFGFVLLELGFFLLSFLGFLVVIFVSGVRRLLGNIVSGIVVHISMVVINPVVISTVVTGDFVPPNLVAIIVGIVTIVLEVIDIVMASQAFVVPIDSSLRVTTCFVVYLFLGDKK